ncbi:hypothetical protein ABN057_09795 [Providencia alcalifaciens]|uniref:hypothetical protein n=1 Tax=Providencia TaxID=586 RepID=UPI0010122C8E|nr:hypothetical protein [Providencia rettgeri]RXN69531.1 hypothetical protein D0Z62_18860 [Providencia rettgeri]
MPLTPELLTQFFANWANANNITIAPSKVDLDDLIDALEEFGITTVKELASIIPNNYVSVILSQGIGITEKPLSVSGHIYTWMILKDFMLANDILHRKAIISTVVRNVFKKMMPPDEFDTFEKVYATHFRK